MHASVSIRSTLQSAAGLECVRSLLASGTLVDRTALARRVCEVLGLLDPCGEPRTASCLIELRRLERVAGIGLMAARPAPGYRPPRGLGKAVPAPVGVPARVDAITALELVPVQDAELRQVWTELMRREHPRGAVTHVGCQVRYLIRSQHGWLGALGFAAAALTLRARDRWIGWSPEQRTAYRPKVVGMSRFLIRPQVRCLHLASKVLGMALRQLPDDFRRRYGYRPVLVETFVDETRHDGVSLRAAGWTRIGVSAGRGRMAAHDAQVGTKAIWVKPLIRHWQPALGVDEALPPSPDEVAGDWAEQELGRAALGDRRLTRRLVTCARLQARQPGASFRTAAHHDRAAVAGYYRLMERPPGKQIPDLAAAMLEPHRQRTLQRMRDSQAVLCLQDGTALNFASRPATKGLGRLEGGRGEGALGLHLHAMLAVDQHGVPLGVPHLEFDAPTRPATTCKSHRWLRGLQACVGLATDLGNVPLINVMDREGDFFEWFRQPRPGVELLVRAQHNRRLGHGLPKLFDQMRATPAQTRIELSLEQVSPRGGASRGRKARIAQLAVTWRQVDLPSPHRRHEPAVTLWAVHASENQPPQDATPVEWLLLTSLPVTDRQQALQVLEWYRLRWRIEDWFRLLKTGCRVEALQLRHADNLQRAVTLRAVIAWRLAALTRLGRDTPQLPAETMFTEIELAVLRDLACDEPRSPTPDDLGQALLAIAMLGGFQNRRHDRPPGYETVWKGYTVLMHQADAYQRLVRLAQQQGPDYIYKLLRPDK